MESAFSKSPAEVKPVLEAQIDQLVGANSPALLFSAALGALWTGTAGFTSVMNALNRVHGVRETRPYVRRVLLAAALTLSVGVGIVAVLLVLLVRQVAGAKIADALGVPTTALRAADLLSIAVIVPLLVGATAVLYRMTPDRHAEVRWITPGAVLFVVLWLGATFLFGTYLANLPSYANAYGVIGTVLVLFTWFFITSFTLLLGAEVDALRSRARHGARAPSAGSRGDPQRPASGG